MKLSNSMLLLSLAAGLVQAGPVTKREVTDADILNYALTLEHLEATFYEQGLKNYTHSDFMAAGCKDPVYANVKRIAEDEKSHEQFLTKALTAAGAKPVERCTYSFPSKDVKSFLAIGSMLEGVGVSAYLGAAAKIMNATYLSEAGSILSVEARHSAYLRAAQGQVPYAQPFDNPLDFNEVYTIASPFIASCPSDNTKLPVKAFPTLMMASDDGMMSAMPGSMVHLMAGEGFEKMMAKDVHAAFITATGPMWASVEDKGDGSFMVKVPMGVAGQSYVVLTRGNTQATDDNIVAGPAIIEVEAKKDGNMGMGGMGMGMGMSSMSMSMSMPSGSMASGSMPSGSMASMSSMPMQSGSMPMAMPSGSMSSMPSMPMQSGSMPMAMPSGSMSSMPSMSMPSASMSASMSSPSSPMFTGSATKNSMSGAVVSGAMGLSALFAALL